MNFFSEHCIIWLDGPHLFSYLREAVTRVSRRAGPIRWRGAGRLVGYAELDQNTPAGPGFGFERRIWWVTPQDPYQDGRWPVEAVDPTSVRAGVRSRTKKA